MFIMKGVVHMKCLKIENGKGFYRLDKEDWHPIDKLNKEDLLTLVNLSLTDDFEMDEFDKEKLEHKAHQVIYKNIFEKLSELGKKKNRFKDESELLYKSAFEKYSRE